MYSSSFKFGYLPFHPTLGHGEDWSITQEIKMGYHNFLNGLLFHDSGTKKVIMLKLFNVQMFVQNCETICFLVALVTFP